MRRGCPQALPVLRQIARSIEVDVPDPMGNPNNTRTLAADIIKSLGATQQWHYVCDPP